MHARNVEKCDVDVDSWLGVDVSALTDLFPTIGRLAESVLIARELLTEIGVNEFTLRVPVLPEDDELTVLVGRVVGSQTRARAPSSSVRAVASSWCLMATRACLISLKR